MNIFDIITIYGLYLLLIHIEGPFGICSLIRNSLMRLPLRIGVFFYKLLSCAYCSGAWCGVFVYAIKSYGDWYALDAVLWALAGGGSCYFINLLVERFSSHKLT